MIGGRTSSRRQNMPSIRPPKKPLFYLYWSEAELQKLLGCLVAPRNYPYQYGTWGPSVQYEEGKKRRKPNYSSVDLSEVEWEDRDDVLRNAMVNRKTGKFSMEVKKTVDKGFRCGALQRPWEIFLPRECNY